MKATSAATSCGLPVRPKLATAACMTPFWKPLTISASGSVIAFARYASSAVTVLPSES